MLHTATPGDISAGPDAHERVTGPGELTFVTLTLINGSQAQKES